MVDFSKLLKKPAGEAPKPNAIPVADYPGVITKWEPGVNERMSPPKAFVRFHCRPTGPADNIEQSELDDLNIDLTKVQLRRDFFFDTEDPTDRGLYYLDEFLRSCGVDPKGRVYEECLPEVIGSPVLIAVGQYVNQNTSEVQNQVNRLVGTAA